MNFEKALKILGLTKDYTEEELKKAYRQLISKYHPDRYENKSDSEKQMAEKKAKEINEAKEYLEKCLKNKTNNSYSRSSSNSYARSATKSNSSKEDKKYEKLKRKKDSILRGCIKQIEEVNSINDNNDKLLRKVKIILSDTFFIYATNIYLADTIFELTILQSELNIKVKEILDTYSKEYCKKYSIVLDEKTKLNLNCYSLKILQHKLEEIKAKNESFIGRIEEEFNKYVYYKGFDDIQIILLKLKKEILLEYKNKNKNKDIEDLLISKFNTKVLQAFEEYYKRLAILNSMKNRCQNSRDSKIIELLIKLENSLSSPEEFEKVFNELNTRISIALVAKNDCIPSKPYIIEEKLDFNSNQPFSEKEENIKIKNNLKFFDKIFKKIKDQNPGKKRIKKY